ncbi:MAG: hypothetical protein QM484_04835 [Woeseiaceae bacterium]
MQCEKKYPLVPSPSLSSSTETVLKLQSPLAHKTPALHQIQDSEPLWKRALTRDSKGKPYADFMMLIPGLKKFESAKLSETISKLESVLKLYEKEVVLADLNLKINVLWVTHQAIPGLTTEIAAFIHHLVPEAKLVSQHRAS